MVFCANCKSKNRDNARFCRRCGARLTQSAGLGMVLGGEYHVVEVIKAGGMGNVYKAESGSKFYAVKEMLDTFTNPEDRQDAVNRFMAEALILARLSHPQIPRVYRHFIENDRYYLVMDLIEGEDLQTVMDRQGGRGLSEEQMLNWALQICDVLDYLHRQSPPIIFRDLKPANIMLRLSGEVNLIDFGIAKLFNPARQGTMIGTPGYAAPEQYQGLAEPRSDIFALGATLHYLLTGRNPQHHPPFTFPSVTTFNPAITPAMEALIQKATRMNLEERWTSINEVRKALASLAGPLKLKTGEVLVGRYHIIGKGMEARFGHRRVWEVTSFEARDVHTGAKCWVIPIGNDPVEDQWARRLASLHHQALSRMEIIAHRGMTCFVSHAVEGVPLESAPIPSSSRLASIGLQLCDLLEITGSHGVGFSWVDLQATHLFLSPQGHVVVDSFSFCYDWLYERHLEASDDNVAKERLLSPFLTESGWIMSYYGKLSQDDVEVAEVEIVASAIALPLVGKRARLGSFRPLELREKLPRIELHLEQAILGAIPTDFPMVGTLWIQSLAQLREHLLGQAQGPARATISTQHIKFGKVPWGKLLSRSIQLSSQSSGLLYGETRCQQLGLYTQPDTFVEVHPAQIKIEISWNTSALEICGNLNGEILITTGIESFRISVQADVRPNAEFHCTQAKRHVDRREWTLAIQHCDKLIVFKPSGYEGYWLRGRAYHELAKYEKAIADYTRAIQINPNKAEIWNQRGNAFLRLKQYDSAIQDYSEAIRLDSKEPLYYWNRSVTYEAQGRELVAINDLQQYVSLGGRDTQAAKQKIAELQSKLHRRL